MSDFESRLSICATLDLNYLASQTEKFTGADLIEICESACKVAI
jgi:transitional endoplasmic reticulum ATPase